MKTLLFYTAIYISLISAIYIAFAIGTQDLFFLYAPKNMFDTHVVFATLWLACTVVYIGGCFTYIYDKYIQE